MGGRSRRPALLFSLGVMAFMLILNCLTPLVADDYVYTVSFATKERLTSLSQIFPSMYVHSLRMNGRVISHGIGQIFMLMPGAVYDAANAGVFALLIYILARVAGYGGKFSLRLEAGIFAGVWCFVPNFGQVALWQIGSVNYLWGLTVGMLFLCPYIYRFLNGGELIKNPWGRAAFTLAALPAGMYIEGMSFVAIFLAACLLILSRLMDKRSLRTWLLAPLALAGMGYCALMLMPAESAAKMGSFELMALIRGFLRCGAMFVKYFTLPSVLYVALFITDIRRGTERRRLALSAVFVLGALAANFMLAAASYYEARCASPTAVLLVLADAALMADVRPGKDTLRRAAAIVLAVIFAVCLPVGVWGVAESYAQFRDREEEIFKAVERGETDLTLPVVKPRNAYSAFWGLLDLNTETRDTWPNQWMAKLYGVGSILGRD